MTQIILPFPILQDGTIAYGSQVQADLEEIVGVVNGSIADDNLSNSGITAWAKIIPASITGGLIASGQIIQDHTSFSSASVGIRAWRSVNYAGANGSRLIRIEKTIALAAVVTEQSFAVDWSTGDCPDGTVTFGAAPTITGLCLLDPAGAMIDATDVIQYIKVGTRSTTGCTVLITFSDAPTAGNVILMGFAAGAA